MAKRKESADTAVKTDTKKPKKVAKGKAGGPRAKKGKSIQLVTTPSNEQILIGNAR